MIVTLTRPLPNTGDLIQAHDIADPITDILAVLNGGIDSDNLAANAVGTSEIADGSVTEAKLAASYFLGWNTSGIAAPTTVTNNGNRSYTLVFNSQDYTQELSEGMKLKFTRTTTAPTQSTSLNGTTQYWSNASPGSTTFTDDFCTGAWIYLTSYAIGTTIISRYNGTSGWELKVGALGQADGRVQMTGYNAGAANYSAVYSQQSLPLNKWVYVAAQLDMSAFTASTTTSYVMIDGVDVPATVTRAGTNPTALVQAGSLQIGAGNATQFFPGKIAQAWYSNAKITQATVRTFMSQGMTGSETSIISAYSFNGTANDLNTTSANNLTAQASAGYTADSPFAGGNRSYDTAGTVDYAIITGKPSFSTNTTVRVQVPEGCTIPTSGGISSVSYSTQAKPYGFPGDKARWAVTHLLHNGVQQSAPTINTWYNLGGKLTVPPGDWRLSYSATISSSENSGSAASVFVDVSTSAGSSSGGVTSQFYRRVYSAPGGATANTLLAAVYVDGDINLSSETAYYVNLLQDGTNDTLTVWGNQGACVLRVTPNFL